MFSPSRFTQVPPVTKLDSGIAVGDNVAIVLYSNTPNESLSLISNAVLWWNTFIGTEPALCPGEIQDAVFVDNHRPGTFDMVPSLKANETSFRNARPSNERIVPPWEGPVAGTTRCMTEEDVFMNSNGKPGTDQSKALFETARSWYPTSILGDSHITCEDEMKIARNGASVPNRQKEEREK
jgi:hypothetical protein